MRVFLNLPGQLLSKQIIDILIYFTYQCQFLTCSQIVVCCRRQNYRTVCLVVFQKHPQSRKKKKIILLIIEFSFYEFTIRLFTQFEYLFLTVFLKSNCHIQGHDTQHKKYEKRFANTSIGSYSHVASSKYLSMLNSNWGRCTKQYMNSNSLKKNIIKWCERRPLNISFDVTAENR